MNQNTSQGHWASSRYGDLQQLDFLHDEDDDGDKQGPARERSSKHAGSCASRKTTLSCRTGLTKLHLRYMQLRGRDLDPGLAHRTVGNKPWPSLKATMFCYRAPESRGPVC